MLVGYARVSSTDQSLELQREQLQTAGVTKLFEEKASGTTTNGREELERAVDWVREGDVLLVTRLDRLARSVGDLSTIVGRLEAKKVGFRCLHQNFDTTSAEGRLMLNILGAFAEFETAIRRERQMEGIAKAKAEGRMGGKPGPRVASAEDIMKLRKEGLGSSAIARQLGIGRRTVYRIVPDGWNKPAVPR